MNDDLSNRGPQDRKRISLSEDWEVKYWTQKLGVSTSDLTAAIKEVGHLADRVKSHLINKGISAIKPGGAKI